MPNDYSFLPQDWLSTGGAGATIALFDTGADLDHPALAHLKQPGCNFDATRQGFNPDTETGNDAIPDSTFLGNMHGTQNAGVIAGRPGGIAPDATLLLFKMRDDKGQTTADYFFKGLQTALRLNVDVIAAPFTPVFQNRGPEIEAEINTLFGELQNSKTIMVTTGPNTGKLARLNTLQFPADRPETILTASLQDIMLRQWANNDQLATGFAQVWPESEGEFCDDPQTNPLITGKWRNSHVTAALAAVIALRISMWKSAEGDQYQRRSKEQILDELFGISLPFSPAALLTDKTFKTYHLRQIV